MAQQRPFRTERKDVWRARGLRAGLTVSVAVHALLLALLAMVTFTRAGGGEGERPIELAVMTEAQLEELTASTASSAPAETPRTQAQAPALNPLSEAQAPAVASSLPTPTQLTAISGAGAEELGEGFEAPSGSGEGSGSASFFGVEARGARFVYIVDVSGSMEGRKLETLQIELTDSIKRLPESARFAVVLFSTDASSLGGASRWWQATEQAKRAISREIQAIRAKGGTNPLPAFEKAFALKPKPDAIYFMTDGLFAESAAYEIAQLNESTGGRITPIHCISFVSREAASIMRSIADRSGGSYTHIEGPGR